MFPTCHAADSRVAAKAKIDFKNYSGDPSVTVPVSNGKAMADFFCKDYGGSCLIKTDYLGAGDFEIEHRLQQIAGPVCGLPNRKYKRK